MRGNPPGTTAESTQPVPLLSYERSDRVDAVTFQTEAMRCERLMYHVGYSILHNDQDCADAVQEALTARGRSNTPCEVHPVSAHG